MNVKPAGDKIVARGRLGKRPVIGIRFYELASSSQTVELFQQQATLAPPAKSEFANELFVTGTLSGRTLDAAK
jgi:hypothetical protein